MHYRSAIIIMAVIYVAVVLGIAFSGERAITPDDRALTQSVPCNGKVEGPMYLRSLFKDASIPQYVCYHSINNDSLFEVALIYVHNPNDSTFELVRAMRINEFWELMDEERELRE